MAHSLPLESELEEAVLLGALSLKEAWLIQDQMLLSEDGYLRLPLAWESMVQRLQLVQTDRPDSLRLS